MDLKEQISDILGAQVLFAKASREKLTKERWQAILRCKEDFFNNRMEDPSKNPCMDQEVAASWMRSRRLGVNPYKVSTIPSEDKLSKVRDKHRQLIDITTKLILPF